MDMEGDFTVFAAVKLPLSQLDMAANLQGFATACDLAEPVFERDSELVLLLKDYRRFERAHLK